MHNDDEIIGLVVVAHGTLADHLLLAMEHVVGRQKFVQTVPIGPYDDVEKRREEIADAIKNVDQGSGVIIITDMFGGTPSNLAISFLKPGEVEVIAGVNLPMLIRLEGARKTLPLKEAVTEARKAGRKYIYIASDILKDEG